jgi:N-acetylmuramic acid 6-phosphate etherase
MVRHANDKSDTSKLVLGIEGGGTKTEWVLLSPDGATIKHGVLPAANLRLISDDALGRMFHALPPDATHVGVLLAGCVNAADRARLHALARTLWPQSHITVGSDRDSGFATAFADQDGITVIAGTGSAVTGRLGERMEKAGGWGQLLGDRGGGYTLAVAALRLVLSNYDIDHRVDALGQSILRKLCLNRLEDLVSWAANADKMQVAKLAPVVFEAAKNEQEEMICAVQNGAHILAEFTQAVARRLEFRAPTVKLLGGLFSHNPEYADLFKDYLSEMVPGSQVSVCADSGALGAAWLAARDLPAPSAHGKGDVDAGTDLAELATAATEQRNPRSAELDKLAIPELVDLFVSEENRVTEALAAVRDALSAAIEIVSHALQNGGRLFYAGAGTSGRLGVLDASEIPPTFSASPELVQGIIAGGSMALHSAVEGAEDQPEAGAAVMVERGVAARDVVCGIAASGRTPFVLGALAEARKLGAKTMLLTCNPARHRAENLTWDVEIDLPTGPELVTGSTRLKAGTATKVALNIISTCSMIRLGKVRGNLMVDVNVSNVKLRDRAIRLVGQVRDCSYEDAEARLAEKNWNVRAALSD